MISKMMSNMVTMICEERDQTSCLICATMLLTVAMTLTMIMIMLAMAETTASMAPAIAETMVPYESSKSAPASPSAFEALHAPL